MEKIRYEDVRLLVEAAIAEDVGAGDITTRALFRVEKLEGKFLAREAGVLCGMDLVREIAARHAPNTEVLDALADGSAFEADAVLGAWSGLAAEILPLERLVLNFLQRLSGVATATRRHVERLEGTTAKVYDTRKTTPGWRKLEKYAVRVGGGMNHREGLFDAALIKDNHLALARRSGMGLAEVVRKVREAVGKTVFVEVEVTRLADLDEALSCEVDAVLLDNMSVQELREAVGRAKRKRSRGRGIEDPDRATAGRRVELEASGGVGLANIRRIAETGVTRISVGALTHSARALDIAFECGS